MSDHPHAAAAAHAAPAAHAEHEHPTWKQYKWVALWLFVITMVEVWIYYTPFKETPWFVPTLLILSVTKFAIVVMYYMHLKFDHKIYRALFVGSLFIAASTVMALLFLFINRHHATI